MLPTLSVSKSVRLQSRVSELGEMHRAYLNVKLRTIQYTKTIPYCINLSINLTVNLTPYVNKPRGPRSYVNININKPGNVSANISDKLTCCVSNPPHANYQLTVPYRTILYLTVTVPYLKVMYLTVRYRTGAVRYYIPYYRSVLL